MKRRQTGVRRASRASRASRESHESRIARLCDALAKRGRAGAVVALTGVAALAMGCPTGASAPCTSDADCGGNAACVVVDGAGVCSIAAPEQPEPEQPEPEPEQPEPDPEQPEPEPEDPVGEGEGEGEGEDEPDPPNEQPEPGPLNLGRPVATSTAHVVQGATFTLRGSLSTSSRATSNQFQTSPRSAR